MEGQTVNLLGREYKVKLPPQFAVVEELVLAWGETEGNHSQRLRVCGAIVGICTDLGREARADYVKARFDVLAYGGAVYGYLREKGVPPAEVASAGVSLIGALAERAFPREAEVVARAGFSEPAADG